MACPPITVFVDRASFGILSKDEIKRISVKHITEPKSFEKSGVASDHGLYSHALGPIARMATCTTCGLSDLTCPGHYGHIELSVPVFHPVLLQTMYQVISKCCLNCFHFRLSTHDLTLFLAQLEALNLGFDYLIDALDEIAKDICRDDKSGTSEFVNKILGDKLTQLIKEEKQKVINQGHEKRPQQRSIVERLSKLFRNFVNGKLIRQTKLCEHCREKKTTLSLVQQSAIVCGSGSNTGSKSKSINIENEEKKPKKRKLMNKEHFDMELDLRYMHGQDKRYLTPIGARYILRQLWKVERRTMERIFHFLNIERPGGDDNDDKEEEDQENMKETAQKFHPTDLFFIDTLIVPPSKFRPPMSQRGYTFEGPGTAALSNVMKQSVIVLEAINQYAKEPDRALAAQLESKAHVQWKELQTSVNCLLDNEMDRYGKHKYPGLKQLIDKKEGLFRKNMMGKRVNFAARSVISPDPNISVDQIGVPLVFAMKLTYPQPVTAWNIKQLREAVMNGPDKYPGAASIVFEDGFTLSLAREHVRQNIASRLSYNPRFNPRNKAPDTPMVTIVNRHLLTGDVLLFNRQPTLHKPSIMAFRARVLPNEKGFRLHYANCKSFNADFDGDEMNAHLPQSELARSEAYHIASVNYQYLVPKDGSPLGGLIQDHVVAVCILTRRDQLFDKERYHQLVFCALSFLESQLTLEPPCILKPEPMWSGKQVITTIIKNCIPAGRLPPTLKIKSKIGPKILNISPAYESLSDCHVYIKDGELLTGFMDKSNVGATQYGLVHACYELYGGETSSNIMSAFARLSTWYLQLYEGFTLGVADLLVEEDANGERKKLIEESLYVGPESASEALGLKGHVSEELLEDKLREAHSDRDPLPMKKLDAAMKKRTDNTASNISGRCLPEGLIRRFPDNNLQMMVQSGAKGGTVNAIQMSCLLGQIELEGRRVPLSMSGRSLPSFKPYDTSPKAGGFVSGRFLTGIQPQEFFFHCMAGREGLIDTAVKTSRSGYLQRCLIKHLEGLTVQYDQTVRDSCGSVIQFLYGEDGLDIVKSQLLKEKAFPLLIDNYKIISPSEDELCRINKAKEAYEEDVIAQTNDIQQWSDRNGQDKIRRVRNSGFLDFQMTLMNDPQQYEQYVQEKPITSVSVKLEEVTSGDGAPKELDVNDDDGGGVSGCTLKVECTTDAAEAQEPEQVEAEDHAEELEEVKEEEYGEGDKAAIKSEECNTAVTKEQQLMTEHGQELGSCPRLSTRSKSTHDKIRQAWYNLSFKEKRQWIKFRDSCPDPLIALLNPASHFGVVPESLDEMLDQFVTKNPQLIINPATLIGGLSSGDHSVLAENELDPDLSKTIATYLNQLPGAHVKPKLTKHEFYNLCYNLYMKMLAQPGEAVGLLAAQSIGEPSTQMTLNTFHFAGRGEMNVTLGIPRLREILMTASAKIGTPSMDLPLLCMMYDEYGNELSKDEKEKMAQRVKLALNAVRLSDVLEYVDISEQVVKRNVKLEAAVEGKTRAHKSKSTAGPNQQAIKYSLYFKFLASKYYKHDFKTSSRRVMTFMEETFIKQLVDSMLKRIKRLQASEAMFDISTKKNINKAKEDSGSAAGGTGDADQEEKELNDYNAEQKAKENIKEDESSSDDDEGGEGDNTAARLKNRRNADLDYEEAEDEDLKLAGEDEENNDDDENEGGDGEEATKIDKDNPKNRPDDDYTEQPDHAVNSIPYVTGFDCDREHRRWCKLSITIPLTSTRLDMGSLIESEAKKTYVHRIGNIQKAFLVKDPKRGVMIKTEGVSLASLVNFDHILHLNAIYSNDVHAIARTYGIEAASRAIQQEMANVFAVYGIEVDHRHLSLIADYMTFSGSIRGMNRMSMESSASPFQQMTFESTLRYLKWATILGLRDDIKSPSASLVFGRPTQRNLFTTVFDTQESSLQPYSKQIGAFHKREFHHKKDFHKKEPVQHIIEEEVW